MCELMFKTVRERLKISGLVVLIYLVCTLLLSVFPWRSWGAMTLGLFLGSIGSVLSFLLLKQWEKNLKNSRVPAFAPPLPAMLPEENPFHSTENFEELQSALHDSQIKQKELVEELNTKNEVIHKLENEKQLFETRIEDVYRELNSSQSESEEDLRRKTVLLSEYQETINQQREVIQKKQEQITELENKVRDLNYEVKTLLQLAEVEKPPKKNREYDSQQSESKANDEIKNSTVSYNHLVKTPEEASSQLKRCIDIAQKMTGANRFGNGNSRFRDMSMDNYALDLRRLFDSLGSENSSPVLVYSQKENRLLFANQQTKNLLGWSPEKFIQNFPNLIQEGQQEWQKGIGDLTLKEETKSRLLLKTKSGQNLLVHCHMGIIPRGVFRNHIVAVLYPA